MASEGTISERGGALHGVERRGMEWPHVTPRYGDNFPERLGRAWRGPAGRGAASRHRHGTADNFQGPARRGSARQGGAWRGKTSDVNGITSQSHEE